MDRFKSTKQAQRFLSVHDQINTPFRLRRYTLSARSYRYARAGAFILWEDYAVRMTVSGKQNCFSAYLLQQLGNTVGTYLATLKWRIMEYGFFT